MKDNLIIFDVIAILLVLVALTFTGCSYTKVEDVQEHEVAEKESKSMFVEIETSYLWKVVYQKDTKVMYAVSYGGYNGGTFTLLVNPDGTPMLYEGDK